MSAQKKNSSRPVRCVVDKYSRIPKKYKSRLKANDIAALLIYCKIRRVNFKNTFKEISHSSLDVKTYAFNQLNTLEEQIFFSLIDLEIENLILRLEIEDKHKMNLNEKHTYNDYSEDYILFEKCCKFFSQYQNLDSDTKGFIDILSCLNSYNVYFSVISDLNITCTKESIIKNSYFTKHIKFLENSLELTKEFLNSSSICLKSSKSTTFLTKKMKDIAFGNSNNIPLSNEFLEIFQRFLFNSGNLIIETFTLFLINFKKLRSSYNLKNFVLTKGFFQSNYKVILDYYLENIIDNEKNIETLPDYMNILKKLSLYCELLDSFDTILHFYEKNIESLDKYSHEFYKICKIAYFLGRYKNVSFIVKEFQRKKHILNYKFDLLKAQVKFENFELRESKMKFYYCNIDYPKYLLLELKLLMSHLKYDEIEAKINEDKFKMFISICSKKTIGFYYFLFEYYRNIGNEKQKDYLELIINYNEKTLIDDDLFKTNCNLDLMLLKLKNNNTFYMDQSLNLIFSSKIIICNSLIINCLLKLSLVHYKNLKIKKSLNYLKCIKDAYESLPIPLEYRLKMKHIKAKCYQIIIDKSKLKTNAKKILKLIEESCDESRFLLKYTNFLLFYFIESENFQKASDFLKKTEKIKKLFPPKVQSKKEIYEKIISFQVNHDFKEINQAEMMILNQLQGNHTNISKFIKLYSIICKYHISFHNFECFYNSCNLFYETYSNSQYRKHFLSFCLKSSKIFLKVLKYSDEKIIEIQLKSEDLLNFIEKTLKMFKIVINFILEEKQSPVVAKLFKLQSMLYQNLGDFDKAEDRLEKSFNIIIEYYGKSHPETAKVYKRTADMLLLKYKNEESLKSLLIKSKKFCNKALNITRNYFGEWHCRSVKIKLILCQCLIELFEFRNAQDLMKSLDQNICEKIPEFKMKQNLKNLLELKINKF